MNLRNTGILFALFLTMLWVFGLMLATKQPLAEEGFLFPSIKAEPAIVVDSISVERPKQESFAFIKGKDTWQLVVGKESTTVDTSRLNPIIDRIKNAKHNPDATLSSDLAGLGLDPPERSITMKGRPEEKGGGLGKERSWTLHLGQESADKMVVYALSSEQPGKVFALTKKEVEPLLFDDPVTLHSQLFFNFPIEEGAIHKIEIKTNKGTLELSQSEGRQWKFEKPALGYAEYDPPPLLKDLKGKATEGGVKGLIYAIRSLRVAEETDFLPLGKASLASYGLEEGKESMRIHVVSQEDKTKKERTHEVLLVGDVVPGKWNEVYVRLAGDPAVAKMDSKHLAPIRKLAANPEQLRSRDLTFINVERLSRLEIRQGKEKVELTHRPGEALLVQANAESPRRADEKSADKLIDALLGKQGIESFHGEPADAKKMDAELGFDAPQLEVKIVENTGEPGKEEAKKEAVTTLLFGKTKGDLVNVKRTLPDGQVSWFEMLATGLTKITGEELTLAYLSLALPRSEIEDVVSLSLARAGSPIEIKRDPAAKEERWLLKDEREVTGYAAADGKQVRTLLEKLGRLRAQQWLKKTGPKEDMSVFGLDTPALTATLFVKDRFSPANLGGMIGLGATPLPLAGLTVSTGGMAQAEAGPPQAVVLRLGKENGKSGEKQGIHATHSMSDLVFLLPPALLNELQSEDFRDRRSMFTLQPVIAWGLFSQASAGGVHALNLASPWATGRLHAFEPAQVKAFKFVLRTPAELRQFTFARQDKAGWKDQTGLLEFTLETEKVDQFLKQLSDVHALRMVSLTGPQAEHKLTPKDALVRVELTLESGETLSVVVGAAFEKTGFYSQSSAQPNLVFLLPPTPVENWLRGLALFSRDRIATAP